RVEGANEMTFTTALLTLKILTVFIEPSDPLSKAAVQCQPTPLDLSVQTLPKDFCSDDPLTVFKQLDKPDKGDFETTTPYQARLNNRPTKPLYVFSSDAGGKYNADTQSFAVGYGFRLCVQGYFHTDCSGNVLGLVTKSLTKSSREYTAANSF